MEAKNPAYAPFTVVVATDFSVAGGYAFDQAARIARRIPGSHLHVVHVERGETSLARVEELTGHLRLYIEEKAAAIEGGLPPQSIGVHVRRGPVPREIAQLATDVAADLIVVGTNRGPHLKQLILGSAAEFLLRAAPCPVFVAGPMPSTHAAAHEPAIEPLCADCLVVRRRTAGKEFWCARHDGHLAAVPRSTEAHASW